ncbi:MAG TPA: 4-oxalocrotonate tautomerase family protein [Polyangia bacterium]|nr:4-oxalocrotonate tautomerase family protein [Polyangia bacterium]
MPRIIVQAITGRTTQQKRELARRLTDTIVTVWGVDPEIVTIRFEEVPPENFARAGLLAVDRPPKERG